MTARQYSSPEQQPGSADLLQLPHLPALHVARTRLTDQLDAAAQHRVCLIIAGAGWGKTTAITAWADPARTAWLTLRARDARLEGLLPRLVAALRPQLPELSLPTGGEYPGSDERVCEAVLAQLSERLEHLLPDGLTLVLDDVQELPVPSAAARFVAGLCRRPPEALHLVLCSRVEPPIPVERLRGQGHLAEINATQLGFAADDVAALLRRTLGDEAADLAPQVWKRTGGCPTLVCFAAEAMRGIDPQRRLDTLAQLSRPGGRLTSYLADEVLGREPEHVQQFLRRLAVLGEITLPVAGALDVEDPARLLADLTRRGLVRRTVGPEVCWSVLRPLRDYLDESVLPETDRAMLHRTAAKELAARGAHGRALQH
ncbi:MAG TPA: AAA family ATPase, partial [Pseudonocardiaceae bacterium]|nr:AAA family ATPase [Pseudonocardiaceae bacterium]